MSADFPCTRPERCGVKTHRAGTGAALRCPGALARAAGPARAPAPPTPRRPSRTESRLEVVLRMLDAEDERAGWDPESGRAHPTGGYDRRDLIEGGSGWVRVSHRSLALAEQTGREGHHRTDGPSVQEWSWAKGDEPQVCTEQWHLDDEMHRGDGPAETKGITSHEAGGPVARSYFWRGNRAGSTRVTTPGSDECLEDLKGLAAAGARPEEGVGWLLYASRELDRLTELAFEQRAQTPGGNDGPTRRAQAKSAAIDMAATGIGVDDALELLEAGVRDPQTAAAVANGTLPISWASA